MSDEEKESRGFTVTDRRSSYRPEEEEGGEESGAEKLSQDADPTGGPGTIIGEGSASADEEIPELPDVSFPTFILSLNHSALIELGATPNPLSGKLEVNLPVAKQTIDIIGMLKDKTKGNLSREEEHLMQNILTDLRFRYVEARGRGQGGAEE